MSKLSDESYECDRCGADCGNGGVLHAAVVTWLNKETGDVKNFHFCLDRKEGGKNVRGCERKLLSAGNLKFRIAKKMESQE